MGDPTDAIFGVESDENTLHARIVDTLTFGRTLNRSRSRQHE